MIQSDVSVGISPRQSFDSWAKFVAELEVEGARRVWVIDSQLAMKDLYAGLVVAALNTTRIGLGTGVTNAVTRHPTITANAIAAIDEISHGRAILGLGAGDSALYGIGLKPQKVAEVAEAIAREVGKYGITLNVVCPGLIPGKAETSGSNSMWSSEQTEKFTPEVREKAAKAYPMRRLGTPEDVVPAILLLASDRASYITGQTLSVSGGYTMI